MMGPELSPAEDPKAFFRQIRTVDREIAELQEVRLGLRASLYSIGGSGAPSGGSRDPDRFGRILSRVEGVEEKITARLERLAALKGQAVEIIEALPDVAQRSVLRRRYLMGQEWPVIARAMHYDERQIYRIHGKALESVRAMCQ